VVVHVLDVSKTGLLAPGLPALRRLQARHRDGIDVVVDACQGRLDAARVRAYLAEGWLVLVTGSKFFTGPAFVGAVVLPPALAARLGRPPPVGLGDYAGRDQWPRCGAAAALPDRPNLGLTLRWTAALAEMRAFAETPPAWRHQAFSNFATGVRDSIAACADLVALADPPLAREWLHEDALWDGVTTIFGFAVLRPAEGATARRAMTPAQARLVYLLLNRDLADVLPDADPVLAGLCCHIGQPAPVMLDGVMAGILRISADGRTVRGDGAQVRRDIASVAAVLAKIGLIRAHWTRLNPRDNS
jgi:hypothetical protein